jgi:hypothetical protein
VAPWLRNAGRVWPVPGACMVPRASARSAAPSTGVPNRSVWLTVTLAPLVARQFARATSGHNDYGVTTEALRMVQSNKAMQLTKLRAAPGRAYKVPPYAPAGQTSGGTASQLIASVRQTWTGARGETRQSVHARVRQ